MALIHHPVRNRNGETIASAVTNLDLHDIARAAKTFGAAGFFVITPVEDQQALTRRIVRHWVEGPAGVHNPDRREALSLVSVTATLSEALESIRGEHGERPLVVVTDAAPGGETKSVQFVNTSLDSGRAVLLAFGTAWGLGPEVLDEADAVLSPIRGPGAYNHLSVRSAVAIYLDRIARGGHPGP